MKLNDDGVAAPARQAGHARPLEIPDDLNAALDAVPAARKHFNPSVRASSATTPTG
jgi:uncharacterized protein YdeI (YjbR/CyaY-like superfamily)